MLKVMVCGLAILLAGQQWSQEGLDAARQFSEKIGSAAVVVMQDGKVVAEWGQTSKPFNIRSMRKSLLNALLGIAVSEGKLKLTSTLAELGVDDRGGVTAAEKKATLADIITYRSAVYH